MVDIGNLIKIKGNINDGIKTALRDISKTFIVTQLDIDELEPSEDNFYKLNNIEEIKESIENFGLQQNLVIMKREGKKYEIIAGHRRFKALQLLVKEGKREFSDIPCRILPTMDDTLKNILIIHTNSETRIKTAWEISEEIGRLTILYRNFKKQRPEFKGRVREAVAKDLGISKSTLGKHENINNNLIVPLKEQYKENKIGISNANQIASLPKEKQEEALEVIQKKGTINTKDIAKINIQKSKIEEPLELQIEAAKYTVCLLEKEIDQCSFQNNALAAAKKDYLGGLIKMVQADLFNMAGDDLSKEEQNDKRGRRKN